MKKIITVKDRRAFQTAATLKAKEFVGHVGGKIQTHFSCGSPIVSIVNGGFPIQMRLDSGLPVIVAKKSTNKQCKERQVSFDSTFEDVNRAIAKK